MILENSMLDVLIVGGGLSGLSVARGLEKAHANWRLLEARHVLGGRLENDWEYDQIDMGGAWVWPPFQPHISRLLRELPIKTFRQPDDPSSTRIKGGAVQFIRTIQAELPWERIQLESPVVSCTFKKDDGSYVEVRVKDNEENESVLRARKVVFAAPPKLISKHVSFEPPLSPEKQMAMAASQTWMAGVTKVSLVYPNAFWDSRYSSMGFGAANPAFQVYDASTEDGKVSALTFFTLTSNSESEDDKALAARVARQVAATWRSMGRPEFSHLYDTYTSYAVKRWPLETYISEDTSPKQINPHPHPVPALAQSEWDETLLFAGTEADLDSPGVMEGAVGAAHRVLRDLLPSILVKHKEQEISAVTAKKAVDVQ